MVTDTQDLHKAVRDLCEKVGGLTASVCNMQNSMECGRQDAIERHNRLEKNVSEVTKDVQAMKPHVEQFVATKKTIIRAAAATIVTSLGLNWDTVSHAIGSLFTKS